MIRTSTRSIILFITVSLLISLQQFRPRSAIAKNSFRKMNLQKKKRKMACAQGKIMSASRRSERVATLNATKVGKKKETKIY